MRTRRFYKYLMAMIIALGTTANVFAQERGLKIYFSENVNGGTPQILVTDDNNSYDLPDGLTVTPEGVVWADKARYWEFFQQNVSDRVIADYTSSDKKKSRLRLTFGNFPYEVNMIQWNIMNDLLSASILDALDNYKITTKCIQSDGSGWQYTDEKWDMNFFAKNITFTQKDVPWKENAVLNGLTSFEIGEEAVGWRVVQTGSFLGIPTYGLRQVSVELDDKCRTFIKAGWNGQNGINSNIADSDDSNWAFKVKFTLPDIRMRCKNIATGNVDDNIIVKEVGVHKIEGYISAHPGAVESKMSDPQDPDDFHFEYTASNNKITIGKTTGIIDKANESGDVDVTVTLKRGTRVVSSYTQTIHVLAVSPEAPQIAIAFADGKKGYDITVGDTNAQVQGIITKNGNDLNGNPINDYSIYHYEYSVDNAGIATIDKNTGKITALKEGDVYVSAVLKDANGNSVTKTYTYLLHVFAPHEGLEFRRINTYHYTTGSNQNNWTISSNTNSTSYDWKSNNLLRVNTSISGNFITDVNDWKQIASFSTNSSNNWRAICQEIAFDLYVPKYTMASATYSFAGNAAIGTSNNGNCKYGFEFYYLNQGEQITQDEAYTRFINRSWNTSTTGNITGTILRTGSDSYHSNVGDGDTYERGTNNVDAADSYNHKKYTVYFAAMAYLHKDHNYPGDVSIGFKGIPEYTYYAIVTYKYNDGTDADWYTERIWSTSKTETKKLYEGTKTLPKRTGYTFLGWSTNPEATTPEYKVTTESDGRWSIIDGDFCPYDNDNGGGKGPVNLYAVWSAKSCTVILSHNGGPGESEQITAVYGQPMPESEDLVAPTWKGHDFNGYRQGISADPTIFYYDANMKSVRNYDQDRENYSIFADWSDHTTKVVFDSQGGNNSGVTQVTATFGQAMPTNGVVAPTRIGYVFEGYYTGVNGAGTQYYTASMTSARTWNIDERLLDPQVTEVTLYAKWTKVVFTVTLDADGGTIDGSVETWPMTSILENNGGSLVLQVHAGESECSEIWGSTRINIKPGYKLLGWYTEPQTESDVNHHPALHPGTLVYSVEPSNNLSYHFSAVPETGSNPKYWNSGTKWVGTDDLTLYAHYEIIFEVEDDVITFTDMTPKNYVLGEDLTAALDYAKEHHVAMVNTIDMRYPDTGESGKNGESIMKAFEDAKEETNSIVSPNALILFTSTWPSQRTTNAVTLNENGGECQNLVVTDRYSMRIPVNFKADKASYARDAQVNDAATEQASKSTWGTLCLPYPIKNDNRNGVKFYWLQSTANNYMEFEEFGDNAIIPANTPVLYSRTDGDVSSKINIVEANVNVPENADYTPVIIDYANPKNGTYPLESASATLQDWEFRGNLKTNIFYGAKYVGEIEENAQRVDNGDVYYFKQNKFTHLTPAMTKMVNGKEVHYNAGKMTIFPYRAYFFKKGIGGSAKFSAYSILVVDEFGNTTDITNTVFGDGEGDGKIYDLNGIRVMQPVKGRLYIVNGQKKVYR